MSTNDLHILIIDDDEVDRKHIIRSLKRSGLTFHVDESNDIEEGKKKLSSHKDDMYDCVFLDYIIPGMDGLQGLIEIHKTHPYLPIIMMTGQGDEMVAAQALKYGAADYVPKELLGINSIRRIIDNAVERGKLNRRMDQQRLELESFARTLAHDLKAPARQIDGFVSCIERDLKNGNHEKLEEYFNFVHAATSKMSALVETLHEYTQTDGNVEYGNVGLQEAVDDAVDILKQEIDEKNAIIETTSLPMVYGNSILLTQLFQNLIGNALKYNEASTPKITITSEHKGGEYIISVRDNGIGIKADYLESVFSPFQRLATKTKYEGSGLGLATCKKIVERHNGEIWCESEYGDNTVFSFTLLPDTVNSTNIETSESVSMTENLNIILIDDSAAEAALLEDALQDSNNSIKFKHYEDPEEALENLKTEADFPDLILLDINMPEIDGYEVLRRLKENSGTKFLPVLMYTGEEFTHAEEQSKQLGAWGIIPKGNVDDAKELILVLQALRRI